MPPRWFAKALIGEVGLWKILEQKKPGGSLSQVSRVLDFLHMHQGLLEPYHPSYPLVEPAELIPPFDAPLIEYRDLPAFSMVALDRPLSYQDEGFQYDQFYAEGDPPDRGLAAANRATLRRRLPRNLAPDMNQALGLGGPTPVRRYVQLMPLLMAMDRGHVLARDQEGQFHLAGAFASFPSDLDGEIKRFGRRVGKFVPGDNESYAANRQFVYNFLMEQTGFPICGERHTSAALFARRLMRRREHFVVKVLGHSDRAITSLSSIGARQGLPRVEKAALVTAGGCSKAGHKELQEGGYYVDPKRRVVLLRVHYNQHAYHPGNVLEDRAMSVAAQEVIHPLTGEALSGLDVLGLSRDRVLLLQDIVRGEHEGSIIYGGREKLSSTAETATRLKFLTAWLHKHRNILADYSSEQFERCLKVIYSYLEDPEQKAELKRHPELTQEARQALRDVKWAHRLRLLEKLVKNRADAFGRQFKHVQILIILTHVLGQEAEGLAAKHPRQLDKLLSICEGYLKNPYLRRRYLSGEPTNTVEREVVGHYKLLANMIERYRGMLAR
ncbi:MAG: hypothetical protein K9K66_09505 [Desulfarculaceae bacterium]|nr:hypothetical protein [Desulfarculaceae bacterium]MCF8073031.1 hypothetical protein [Desulfarculaceae bacterium]MCF8101884.1 hypothetical protein [Desulfarculaceae bacterium]MCF8115411.1 hypothetical protein [Desulfarculaceae bacterium]